VIIREQFGFIEFDGLRVLADVAGVVDSAWKFLELAFFNRLQRSNADFGALSDLLER
jgi:hypothetical protein